MMQRVADPLIRLMADRRGLKAIEYGILAAFIVVAVAGLATPLDDLLTQVYDTMVGKIPV
jgi:Flp pilus assembly pilin Flp